MQRPRALNYFAKDRLLEITWSPDHVGRYPTRHLRIHCPCAGCVDEHTGVRTLDVSTIPEGIDIQGIEPVGNYAVRIVWEGGHDTGLYSWDLLQHICPCPRCTGDG